MSLPCDSAYPSRSAFTARGHSHPDHLTAALQSSSWSYNKRKSVKRAINLTPLSTLQPSPTLTKPKSRKPYIQYINPNTPLHVTAHSKEEFTV
jgi:hypothetical protein